VAVKPGIVLSSLSSTRSPSTKKSARASPEQPKRAKASTAVAAFSHFGCSGLARADFFVEGERVLLNELNTMPGFTPTSVYAKLWEISGLPYPQLVERLCELALERHAEERGYTF